MFFTVTLKDKILVLVNDRFPVILLLVFSRFMLNPLFICFIPRKAKYDILHISRR